MNGLRTPHHYHLLYVLAGSVVLSALSTLQKAIIAAPLTIEGFLVPVIYGGVTGFLIGVSAERLKLQNRQLQELVVARQWMLRDLHHRTKNNLQVVSSVLDLELAGCSDCAVGSASRLRIDLLAGIHQVLYEMNAQYAVDLRYLLERHLRAVYGRFCGGAAMDAVHDEREAAVARIDVPLDTAVVVTMIVNEMIAECEGYWNCERESSLSVACTDHHGRCEVRVHLPAAVVKRVPDYNAGSERIRFRDTLVTALADQINAEATITWEPNLSGAISFSLDDQRRYGRAAAGTPAGAAGPAGSSTR